MQKQLHYTIVAYTTIQKSLKKNRSVSKDTCNATLDFK